MKPENSRFGSETTVVEALASFAGMRAVDVSSQARDEARRIILDSIGCALAAVGSPAGQIGTRYGEILGAGAQDVTVIGHARRSSLHGAAFANCELVSALDMAPINQPGHVAPYVVPAALAVGEERDVTLDEVVTAVAIGLEITSRFARAMDTNRAVKDGEAVLSEVMGFSSSIFGATAAVARLRGVSPGVMRDALGIAAATSPVNSLRSWQMHTPSTSVKYGIGGGLVQSALNAAFLAELGHRGDPFILDDRQHGYPRFIGTDRWEAAELVGGLGKEWTFPSGTHFKPYPHCRVTHAVFDALIDLVQRAELAPDEIESIVAYGEAWATGVPTYMNTEIERPYDAQFSFAHGISVAAHLVPPGRAWQDPSVVYDPSVLDLMSRVEWRPHEAWAEAYSAHPSARPTRVEVAARGTTFVEERQYPKGSPSPDPATYMTTDELIAKFVHNSAAVVPDRAAQRVVDGLLTGESIDTREFMASLVAA